MRAVILQSDQRRLLQEEGTLAESCTVRRLPFGREQSGKEHFIEGTVSTKALRQETLVMCSRPRKEVKDFPGCPVVNNTFLVNFLSLLRNYNLQFLFWCFSIFSGYCILLMFWFSSVEWIGLFWRDTGVVFPVSQIKSSLYGNSN